MGDSLLVPIELDVLLADPALVARDNFLCWKYQYINLNDNTFHSPEPPGFDDTFNKMTAGAYLHWELPRSLRSGREGSSSDYPLVPNRWLIIRVYRDNSGHNVQKSWVLESDCPSADANHASYFMVSDAVVNSWKNSTELNRNGAAPLPISTVTNTGAYTVNIGKAFDLAGWKEQTSGNLFLTAVAPGNLAFSAYVSHNEGVFSFYDDLLDAPSSTLLSYFVTGWYSDLAGDIAIPGAANFTGASTIGEVLKALKWTIAGNLTTDEIGNSLYTGMAFALPWNSHAQIAPAPDQLEDTLAAKNLTVAIGNTGVDAFSTLIGSQITLPDYTDPKKVIELVRAFHYDLLPVLNQVNGNELLQERFRQEWFASKYSGKKWTITFDKASDDDSTTVSSLTDAEEQWLLQLNIDQKGLDDAMEELYSLQWELNAAWWKKNYMSARAQSMSPNQTGIKITDLEKLLDTAQPNSLLTKVINHLALIDQQLPRVPQPVNDHTLNAQDSFLNGVTAFATAKGIGTGKSLKAVTQSRFWKPNNPTVLISGVQSSTITDPDDSLVVRLSLQLVDAFTVSGNTITGSSLGNIIPSLTNSNVLPSGVLGLYQEFFLLDPANAQQIAIKTSTDESTVRSAMTSHDPKAYTAGILPMIDLKTWSQEWNPLYLEWKIAYTPIPFEQVDKSGARTRNWSFNGTDYDLKTSAAASGSTQFISGRSLLSPHTQFTFGARLKAFVDQYGKTEQDLQSLYTAIQNADNWKFLSQELVNFNDFLSQRDQRTFRRPTSEMFSITGTNIPFSKVIGYADSSSMPPYDTPSYGQNLVNTIPAVNFSGPSDFPFHGIRSGQCYLSHIVLYDKFGRLLDLIDPAGSGLHDANNFPLVRDTALMVNHNLNPAITAPFQLPPRLLQPARLDMLLVDQKDSTKALDYAAGVNPICGWVIANHLDQSLLIYGPDGSSMGEIKLIQGISGDPLAQWSAPSHNTTTTINDIANITPQLAAFVTAIQGKTVVEFEEFLGVIDSTLWTTDPLGSRTDQNLSVLIGRPLALLRVMLQFSLDGSPIASCDWPTPVKAPKVNAGIPDFTSSDFCIRFGNLLSREDGVIGYFENEDYSIFNSVAIPQSVQGYVSEIGGTAGQDGNYINLPFDGETTETITLLVDPRASIHATTGIFPVKELKIPSRFIDSALSNMEISFRVGPLLSRTQPSSTTNGENAAYQNSISYLPISEKNGEWSWWENTVVNPGAVPATYSWQGFDLKNADTKATLNDSPASLHEGYLQFVTNLDPGSKQS